MPETPTFEVEGNEDTTQLNVKGHSTQTEPLQTWQDNAGSDLAQVSGDGRVQVGDEPGLSTLCLARWFPQRGQ